MIPIEIIIRIDARGLSLIEMEQIAQQKDILNMIRSLPNRKCWIDLKLEEVPT